MGGRGGGGRGGEGRAGGRQGCGRVGAGGVEGGVEGGRGGEGGAGEGRRQLFGGQKAVRRQRQDAPPPLDVITYTPPSRCHHLYPPL